MEKKALLVVLFCVASLFASDGFVSLRTDINLGFNGGGTAGEFAADTVDSFGRNWRALQIPLETGRSYEESISPFFALTFGAGYKGLSMWIEAPLRKDLEAWYDSDLKTNFTIFPSELDINVPRKAYARWYNSMGFVQAGRFKPEVGPSENTLTIGGAPHHDAIWWQFRPSIFRYDFMLISLNPWLHGDTVDKETGCPPEGTEAQAQKCPEKEKQASNQRDRIYDENYKNLVFHRIGLDLGFMWASFTEMSMIGGKALEFRSINPFILWHNNFAGGYTKASVTFELGARPARGAEFYGQVNIEDLKSPVGETGGASNRMMLSYMVGYSQSLETSRFGTFKYRFDVVLTDPIYNHGRLPLLGYTSRQMYRSNYREQSDKDFADMYYVDYPIGYRRGPDALDLWFTASWRYKNYEVELELAYLQQGDKELYDSYDDALSSDKVLSGVVESQWLANLIYRQKIFSFMDIYLGGGMRYVENLDHEQGNDETQFWLRSGLSLSFEFIKGNKN